MLTLLLLFWKKKKAKENEKILITIQDTVFINYKWQAKTTVLSSNGSETEYLTIV